MLFKKDSAGFTLIEVMIVVAIGGIIAAIAVPSFSSMLPNIRLKGAARDLYSNMQKAKIEAVKRNRNCTITFNQTVASTTFVYIVYVDADGDCEYDTGELILVQLQQWPKDVMLAPDLPTAGDGGLSFTDNDDSNPSIAFRPIGIPTANGGGFANGSAFLTNINGQNISVVVSQAGNISIR